jgi:hypothetical protein
MKSALPSEGEEITMLPHLPISTSEALTGIGIDRALPSNFPQASGGNGSYDKDSLDSFLAKLNDSELRILRDQLREVQARVFATRSIRTIFAQLSRVALQEFVESLD